MTPLADLQLNAELVELARLQPNPVNPRRISKQRFDDLKYSMVATPRMLWVRPLIANLEGTVFAGNMRLRAALDLGWTEIPAALIELSEEEQRYWTYLDNQGYGEWDEEMLAEQLYSMHESQLDMRLTGFSEDEIKGYLASVGVGEEERPEKGSALDPEAVTIQDPTHVVSAGDVWTVGQHVLVCASVHTGHELWAPLLDAEASLFLPYAGPGVTLVERAERHVLVMVQPDPWICGHILDAHERRNPDSVTKR